MVRSHQAWRHALVEREEASRRGKLSRQSRRSPRVSVASSSPRNTAGKATLRSAHRDCNKRTRKRRDPARWARTITNESCARPFRHACPCPPCGGILQKSPADAGQQSGLGDHGDTPKTHDAGWSSPVAREAHNLEVAGSNPVPATLKPPRSHQAVAGVYFLFRGAVEHGKSRRAIHKPPPHHTYAVAWPVPLAVGLIVTAPKWRPSAENCTRTIDPASSSTETFPIL